MEDTLGKTFKANVAQIFTGFDLISRKMLAPQIRGSVGNNLFY